MYKTFKYRIKDRGKTNILLQQGSKEVNIVWNYLNEIHSKFDSDEKVKTGRLDNREHFIKRKNFLQQMTNGAVFEFSSITQHTIRETTVKYSTSRKSNLNKPLRWRGKKSLGWIPFAAQCITNFDGDSFVFKKNKFKIWKSREVEGKIKTGEFVQDSKGRWFVCFVCELEDINTINSYDPIGIDLGFKDIAALSNGVKYEAPKIFRREERKLKRLQSQRAKSNRLMKKRRHKKLAEKVSTQRKDFLHKITSEIVKKKPSHIVVGDISSRWGIKQFNKSSRDAAHHMFKSMLEYKCKHAGIDYSLQNEAYTTQTCSSCGTIAGPKGKSGLKVREWTCCYCDTLHDRDINAAKNILRSKLGSTPQGGSNQKGLSN